MKLTISIVVAAITRNEDGSMFFISGTDPSSYGNVRVTVFQRECVGILPLICGLKEEEKYEVLVEALPNGKFINLTLKAKPPLDAKGKVVTTPRDPNLIPIQARREKKEEEVDIPKLG
jgi:hypothetical protein